VAALAAKIQGRDRVGDENGRQARPLLLGPDDGPGHPEAITEKNWDNESPKGTPWDQKVRAITNAELRWIYRHRKEADVAKRVQFWSGGAPCKPPWEQDPNIAALWNA
jgi:hypothetical protein